MNTKNKVIYIILWFVIILVWMLFCYNEVRDAYYGINSTNQSAFITDENVFREDMLHDSDKNSGDYLSGDSNDSLQKENDSEADYLRQDERTMDDLVDKTENSTKSPSSYEIQAQNVRVLLLNDKGTKFHENVILKHNDEILDLKKSSFFNKTDKIRISPMDAGEKGITVLTINKPYGNPVYEGILEIYKEEEGYVIINELPLETYIKGVLPGEMSAGFPMEALKAQAVCARTYTVMMLRNMAYPAYNAAVDDSISSQVYMMQERNEKADLAVEETKSQLLYQEGDQLANCYYYSTSCGKSATEEVWDMDAIAERVESTGSVADELEKEFSEFIHSKNDSHLEKEEPFYRWTYTAKVSSDDIYDKCNQRGLCDKDYGKIKELKIICRDDGGAAQCIEIVCKNGSFRIMGEYNIRYVLSHGGDVILQNDSAYDTDTLLPSAFLTITCKHNKRGELSGYDITGGGFGHGIGMSQNGAKYMAKAGNTYIDILQTYYKGSYIKQG